MLEKVILAVSLIGRSKAFSLESKSGRELQGTREPQVSHVLPRVNRLSLSLREKL